jgi:hypothetical protein
MAISSGVAIGTGIAAGIGATAAAIRAAKQKTKPKQTPYASGEDVYGAKYTPEQIQASAANLGRSTKYKMDQLGPRPSDGMGQILWDQEVKKIRAEHAQQAKQIEKWGGEQVLEESGYDRAVNPLLDMQASGAEAYANATNGIVGASNAAEQQRQIGLQIAGSANAQQRFDVGQQDVSNQGMDMLNGYQPGAVSNAMSRVVLDQNAQANLGAARSQGALGLRNALNANAQAGVGAAGQMAYQRALEEQQHLGARVGQANADREALLGQRNFETGAGMQSYEAQQARILDQAQLGLGTAQNALGTGLQASATMGQQAIAREQTAAAGLDSIRGQQLEADINYDTRRQQEGQRRSDRLWNLAGGLIGVGGAALGKLGGK